MRTFHHWVFFVSALTALNAAFADAPSTTPTQPATVSSLNVDELLDFDRYPRQVRGLVESALALTHLGLTYTYGSSDPSLGGMDCSGTIYHVLRFQGVKQVPRQSDEMCAWVRNHSQLHLTPTAQTLTDPEFAELQPGDLLFWASKAETERKLPVTHVMLYLGRLKTNGKPVIFGASDGRSFAGQRRCGVSVFDFHLPKPGSTASFYAYGPIPGLQRIEPATSTMKEKETQAANNEEKVATAIAPGHSTHSSAPAAKPKAPSSILPKKHETSATKKKITPATKTASPRTKAAPLNRTDNPAR